MAPSPSVRNRPIRVRRSGPRPLSRLKGRHPALEYLEARPLMSGVTAYPLPDSGANPVEIVEGPDGALWFTENGAGAIGRITPSGTITHYLIPTSGSGPLG